MHPRAGIEKGTVHQGYVVTGPIDGEHDYDEPYFEPASEFDILLEQLKELAVTNLQESSLRSVEVERAFTHLTRILMHVCKLVIPKQNAFVFQISTKLGRLVPSVNTYILLGCAPIARKGERSPFYSTHHIHSIALSGERVASLH